MRSKRTRGGNSYFRKSRRRNIFGQVAADSLIYAYNIIVRCPRSTCVRAFKVRAPLAPITFDDLESSTMFVSVFSSGAAVCCRQLSVVETLTGNARAADIHTPRRNFGGKTTRDTPTRGRPAKPRVIRFTTNEFGVNNLVTRARYRGCGGPGR